MASVTLKLVNQEHRWPVGTTVGLYKTAQRAEGGRAPIGAAVASASVASDGSLSFASVANDVGVLGYTLWASTQPAVQVKVPADQAVSWAGRH